MSRVGPYSTVPCRGHPGRDGREPANGVVTAGVYYDVRITCLWYCCYYCHAVGTAELRIESTFHPAGPLPRFPPLHSPSLLFPLLTWNTWNGTSLSYADNPGPRKPLPRKCCGFLEAGAECVSCKWVRMFIY